MYLAGVNNTSSVLFAIMITLLVLASTWAKLAVNNTERVSGLFYDRQVTEAKHGILKLFSG